jgi:ABC-type multidrug transport system ATPase subunit
VSLSGRSAPIYPSSIASSVPEVALKDLETCVLIVPGFCEQMDLHDGTATVREALEFSAVLRQDRSISRADKIAYVDKIIDLLELHDMQDALIRCLGVEQRKRVTIGVELAAKPSLLLFLDEPTSGLDSQSAYSIVRFLKKLSQAGQAIICTIHQPSSVLIQEFDMILALNPGGNSFYFGPVGDNGSAVIKYFADRGVECPPNKNGMSFMFIVLDQPLTIPKWPNSFLRLQPKEASEKMGRDSIGMMNGSIQKMRSRSRKRFSESRSSEAKSKLELQEINMNLRHL